MHAPIVHIQLDKYGIPRMINKRVKVKMIVQRHLFAGESLTDICDHYGIELADAHAALAYYYDNQAEMDADFAEAEVLIREVGISSPELRAKIEQRLHDMQNNTD